MSRAILDNGEKRYRIDPESITPVFLGFAKK